MQTNFTNIFSGQGIPRLTCLALLLATASWQMNKAHAELSSFGDITDAPNGTNVTIEALGYGIPLQPADAGNLIVGDRDVAGILVSVAFDPGPLITTSGVVGNQVGSYGAVSLDGFPSDWLVGDDGTVADSAVDLIVGNEGTGVIDLFDSAKVQVGSITYDQSNTPTSDPPSDIVAGAGVTVLGRSATGYGQVTITNIASRLVTADLIVADAGEGDITVQSRGALYSANTILGDDDNSIGTVTVSNLGSRWFVGDSVTTATLDLGNDVGAIGRLNINDRALVRTTGVVTVNATSEINLSGGGELRDIGDVAGSGGRSTIENGGVISGDGLIAAAIDLLGSGVLSNRASGADTREHLRVEGEVDSTGGLIDSFRGEMTFASLVTLNGAFSELIARDAILNFEAGLTSTGSIILGGDTTVHAIGAGVVDGVPITIGGGDVTVLGGSVATVVGDLVFTAPALAASLDGESELAALSSGPALNLAIDDTAVLVVDGNLDLGGIAELSVDYVGEDPLEIGDIVSAISVTGDISGEFAASKIVSDGRFWDIMTEGDEIQVMAGALVLPGAGDFDLDGDIDGSDFLAWQRGPADSDNLLVWQDGYGSGSAPLSAASSAVPEPSTLALALLTLVCCPRRRAVR